jgi:hypothetical protein
VHITHPWFGYVEKEKGGRKKRKKETIKEKEKIRIRYCNRK